MRDDAVQSEPMASVEWPSSSFNLKVFLMISLAASDLIGLMIVVGASTVSRATRTSASASKSAVCVSGEGGAAVKSTPIRTDASASRRILKLHPLSCSSRSAHGTAVT